LPTQASAKQHVEEWLDALSVHRVDQALEFSCVRRGMLLWPLLWRLRERRDIARDVPSGGSLLQCRAQPLWSKVPCPRATSCGFEFALPTLDSFGGQFRERYPSHVWLDVFVQTNPVAI
jgi:hypothetical protein